MKLLLDTQLVLWAAGIPERLPPETRSLIDDSATELIVSTASLWEIAIKSGLGRPDFSVDPHLLRRCLLENGYEELPVSGAHATVVDLLPPIHRDPFDRILVAQAQIEGITLLTTDEIIVSYPGPIRFAT